MGGKGGGGDPKMSVTTYYASIHFAICHGPIDAINRIYFNEKVGWREGDAEEKTTFVKKMFTDAKVENWSQVSPSFGTTYDDRILWELPYKADWAELLPGGYLIWYEHIEPTPDPVTVGPMKKRMIKSVEPFEVKNQDASSTPSDPVYITHTYMLIKLEPDTLGVGIPEKRWFPFGLRWSSSFDLHVYAEGERLPGDPEPPPTNIDNVQRNIYVNAPNLFGGQKKEGGVQGNCHLMYGTDNQFVPDRLAQKLGRRSETMPAYRGIATAWFHGTDSTIRASNRANNRPSFYWTCNSNRIPDVWINITRVPKGFLPELSRIGDDANPAHIIYEVMTNTDWGMGATEAMFDMTSWGRAAQTLYDERFGLSMIWSDQMEIEQFVSEVIDHIEGSLFVHPSTGLFTLKLIRDDYDEDALRELTPDNSVLSNFQRKAWGETVNEITVTYRNPENEEEMSFTIQDTANIGMQGNIITDNRNYYGIRNADLAARVGERDLRSAAAPLCSCSVEVNRSGWNLVPGEVVKVTWPEYGLNGLVMRVGPVDYGRPGEPRVRVDLIEDIFFMPSESYFTQPETQWLDPREAPVPIRNAKVFTAPYYSVMSTLGITDETSPNQLSYPEVMATVLASTYQMDAQDYALYAPVTDSVGNTTYQELKTLNLVGYAILSNELVREVTSYADFNLYTPTGGPIVSGFVLIGDGDEYETELAAFEEFDNELGWKLRRGVLDTVPRNWPEGTPVRFFDNGMQLVDSTVRSDFDDVSYKLLTRTSMGELGEPDAPFLTDTLNGRPHYPFRPANVRMNGILWGATLVDGADGVNLTWATRSRLQETSVLNVWSDASVIPEADQVTVVSFYDQDDELLVAHDDLTGTSVSLPFTAITGPSVTYRVESERDGHRSLQAIEHTTEVAGYGMNYGNYYGGKP